MLYEVITLACLLQEKEYDVSLWALEKEVADEINTEKTNSLYFPGVTLPSGLKATSSLDAAVRKARYILNVVPTQFTRSVFTEVAGYIGRDATLISASKGIEQGTLLTVSGILREVTGRRVAVLSGPSFAKEVIRKFPTAVTLASEDLDTGVLLQEILWWFYGVPAHIGYFEVLL